MTVSKELEILTRLNKDMQNLITDLNIVVGDLSILSQMVYDKEIKRCDDTVDIKLQSHM